MKKLAILLIAILGLTGCQASDTSSEGLVISQDENAKTEARATQTEEAVITTATTNSEEVSYEPLDKSVEVIGFSYVADKIDIINLTKVALSKKNNCLMLYHEFKSGEKFNLTPTNIKIIDGVGNEGHNYGCGNIQSSGDGLDITQKHFTVWYEFANDPEIGILRSKSHYHSTKIL